MVQPAGDPVRFAGPAAEVERPKQLSAGGLRRVETHAEVARCRQHAGIVHAGQVRERPRPARPQLGLHGEPSVPQGELLWILTHSDTRILLQAGVGPMAHG
ncbi:MAG: hypothetical protein PVI30_27325 [Myxococcales bacterium]